MPCGRVYGTVLAIPDQFFKSRAYTIKPTVAIAQLGACVLLILFQQRDTIQAMFQRKFKICLGLALAATFVQTKTFLLAYCCSCILTELHHSEFLLSCRALSKAPAIDCGIAEAGSGTVGKALSMLKLIPKGSKSAHLH